MRKPSSVGAAVVASSGNSGRSESSVPRRMVSESGREVSAWIDLPSMPWMPRASSCWAESRTSASPSLKMEVGSAAYCWRMAGSSIGA